MVAHPRRVCFNGEVLPLLLLACTSPGPPAPAASAAQVAPAPEAPPPVSAVVATETPAPAPAEAPAPPPAPPPRKPLSADALPTVASLPEPTYDNYPALVAGIEAARRTFATGGTYAQARAYLRAAITERIIPSWKGTRWAFYGMDTAPSDGGAIACGYWVASVLRDAGLRIDRDHVGKQASEKILLTIASPARLRHYGRHWEQAIATADNAGVGLWGVGLASHAGLLWNDGTEVQFCHSDYHGTQGPRCEPAIHSWAFQTSYTVIAPILDDATLDAWFEGRTLATGRFAG